MSKKTIWYVLIVLWCILIFQQSDKPAVESSQESMGVVIAINSCLEKVFGPDNVLVSEKLIRKSGHFLEYMVLGILCFKGFFRRDCPRKSLMLIMGFGVFYAMSDEIHQYFVPGRTMRVFDLLVDSTGLLAGVILSFYVKQRHAKSKDNQL